MSIRNAFASFTVSKLRIDSLAPMAAHYGVRTGAAIVSLPTVTPQSFN